MIGIAAEAGDRPVVFVIDRRLVIEGQVAKTAIASRMLSGKAKIAGAVLIAPGDLPALIAAHPALGIRGIHNAKVPELHHRPGPAQRQRLRPFRVSFKGQPVRYPVAIRTAARRRTIIKIVDPVVAPQASQRHRPIAQAAFKQFAGDIERQRSAHLPSQRIGGDQHRVSGPVNIGQIRQGKGARLKLRRARPIAINKEIDRGGNRCFPGEFRQRPGHQIRAQGEVTPVAYPTHTHAGAPAQGIADHIPGRPGGGVLFVGDQQGGVIAHISGLLAVIASEIFPHITGRRERTAFIEVAELMPQRSLAAHVFRVVSIKIVIQQRPAPKVRFALRGLPAKGGHPGGHPFAGHGEQQTLCGAVVLHANLSKR